MCEIIYVIKIFDLNIVNKEGIFEVKSDLIISQRELLESRELFDVSQIGEIVTIPNETLIFLKGGRYNKVYFINRFVRKV